MNHGSAGLGAGPVITVVVLLILGFLLFRHFHNPDDGVVCPEGATRVRLEYEDQKTEFCEMNARKHGPLRTWHLRDNRTLVQESYDRGRKCGNSKRFGSLGELLYENEHRPCSYDEEE